MKKNSVVTFCKSCNQLGKSAHRHPLVCSEVPKLYKSCASLTILCFLSLFRAAHQVILVRTRNASSVCSKRKRSLRRESHSKLFPDWLLCKSWRDSSALPSSVHGGGSGSDTDRQRCWSTLATRSTELSRQTSPLIQNTGNWETLSNQRAERN